MKNWFKNLKIKSKMVFITIIAGVGILATGFVFKYLVNTSHVISLIFKGQRLHNVHYHMGAQEFFQYLSSHDQKNLDLSYVYFEKANGIVYALGNIKELIANNSDEKFTQIVKDIYHDILDQHGDAELLVNRLKLLLFIDMEDFNEAIKVAAEAYQNGLQIKSLVKTYVSSPDPTKLQSIQSQIDDMHTLEKEFAVAVDHTFHSTRFVLFTTVVLVIILLVGWLAFSMRVLNNAITLPVIKLIDIVNIIRDGDLSAKIDINSQDEIGQLASSLQNIQKDLQQKVNHTKKVKKGDFTATLVPASDKDELSLALIDMTNSILDKDSITKEQVWLKTGQNDLSEKIRGDLEIPDLSNNIINYIAEYMNAQIGAIYYKDEAGELSLTGSYAFSRRKNISSKYKIGEGLVGQCALEKKSIIISNVPDDYIKINSGIGESTPLTILVAPLLIENQVTGVIELGSFFEFTDLQLRFLNQISEMLAIAFQTAISRIKMRQLLETTQNQTEEMDLQREQLRVTNEELKIQQEKLNVKNNELEKQTKILKDSEAKLQAQQEELRQTNEELEEKTESLEKYTMEVREKNQDLNSAQILLEKRAKELEFTSKYKSEFLANMSHELRTPLNSMLILSKMLLENKEGNLTDKQVKFATTVNSAGNELLELINDILDLSKVEAGKMALNIEDIDLKSLVNYLEQNYKHMASEKNLYLETVVSDNLPPLIRSDRQKVEQIIKNLISNSFKFTQTGGVTISLEKPDNQLKYVRSDLNKERTVCISVSDTGLGIPLEKQKMIFEAFQQVDGTTNRKFGGTGLGLSISKEFATLLGGEMHLQSQAGKGSTFRLILPYNLPYHQAADSLKNTDSDHIAINESNDGPVEVVTQTKAADRFSQSMTSESIQDDRLNIGAGDKTILIVEDDARFAKILFDLSREKGFRCLIAVDGEAGLQLAYQFKPSAIILDVDLPRMDGWGVMQRLKNNPETKHIPVHFISVSEKSKDAMKMGAIGFLRKPVNMTDLNEVFTKFEGSLNKTIKRLLLLMNDKEESGNILKLINSDDVETVAVNTGKNALKLLRKEKFDCLVADLAIEDIPGLTFIKKVRKDDSIPHVPVIVYSKNSISREEEAELSKYSESIILKSEKFIDRLQDETMLFLHRVEKSLPEEKHRAIKMTHDKAVISG